MEPEILSIENKLREKLASTTAINITIKRDNLEILFKIIDELRQMEVSFNSLWEDFVTVLTTVDKLLPNPEAIKIIKDIAEEYDQASQEIAEQIQPRVDEDIWFK